jgi:signal transduction histidine kinase
VLLALTRTARPDAWLVQVTVRAAALVGGVVAAVLAQRTLAAFAQVGVLLVVALIASAPAADQRTRWMVHLAEAAAVGFVVVAAGADPGPALPYVLVPPIVTALEFAVPGALLATAVTGLVTLAGGVATSTDVPRLDALLWVCAGLALGVAAAWWRRQQRRRSPRSYFVAANRLLTELRDITRQLPGGLDEVGMAASTLADLRSLLPFDRAALFARLDSGALVCLAQSGDGGRSAQGPWLPAIDEEPWAKAWRTGRPAQREGTRAMPTAGARAVLPLQIGERTTGLIAVERDAGPWTSADLARCQDFTEDASLRLQTGRLFSEVRAFATVEERRRLAREIHDGIAQEVAGLGFVVDDLISRAEPQAREDLVALRDQLTRLVSDLRLSIFDLRSDVEHDTGLGAALSSYARTVGTDSGLTVHLVLDESTARFPAEVESELLRIAQEAITNTRRHAHARNLWLTCRVAPPAAFLRIADDGSGMGTPRRDSYGLEIMRERALRIGAKLTIRPRFGGGTVVEAAIGPRDHVISDLSADEPE